MKITLSPAFILALCGLCQLSHAWVLDSSCEKTNEIPNLGDILRSATQAAFAMAKHVHEEMAKPNGQQSQAFKDLVGFMFGGQSKADKVVGGLSPPFHTPFSNIPRRNDGPHRGS
jgi:hypothetical protein